MMLEVCSRVAFYCAQLPTGFFEEPPVETAPEPRAPSANGPRGRLSSMLPPPKNAPVRRGITAGECDRAAQPGHAGRIDLGSRVLTLRMMQMLLAA
eukprot:4945052-Pleurochrysis_carterae.AAC.3